MPTYPKRKQTEAMKATSGEAWRYAMMVTVLLALVASSKGSPIHQGELEEIEAHIISLHTGDQTYSGQKAFG